MRRQYRHTDTSINRIRLEFKEPRQIVSIGKTLVLIESDWNLKQILQIDLSNVFMY